MSWDEINKIRKATKGCLTILKERINTQFEKKREFEKMIASGELGAYALTWLDRDDNVRVIIKRIEIGKGFTLTDEIPRQDEDDGV